MQINQKKTCSSQSDLLSVICIPFTNEVTTNFYMFDRPHDHCKNEVYMMQLCYHKAGLLSIGRWTLSLMKTINFCMFTTFVVFMIGSICESQPHYRTQCHWKMDSSIQFLIVFRATTF